MGGTDKAGVAGTDPALDPPPGVAGVGGANKPDGSTKTGAPMGAGSCLLFACLRFSTTPCSHGRPNISFSISSAIICTSAVPRRTALHSRWPKALIIR